MLRPDLASDIEEGIKKKALLHWKHFVKKLQISDGKAEEIGEHFQTFSNAALSRQVISWGKHSAHQKNRLSVELSQAAQKGTNN